MSIRPELTIDPHDPRAPSAEVWAKLSDSQRAQVLLQLPSEIESAPPPEGDSHRKASAGPLSALDAYFKRTGRRVYLSSNLPVYYPDEQLFAPDLIAVMDVEPHDREHWVVSHEGKGLDLALEILSRGDRRKELERNVERYARLGIQEYFVFDRKRSKLAAYSLGGEGEGASSYAPIIPQHGRWRSSVLGLEFGVEADRLRLFSGTAPVPELSELAERAELLLQDAQQLVEAAELRAEEEAHRAEEEARRAEEEARRAEEEAERAKAETRRAQRAEAEVERLRAELEALKSKL